jgi:hypothetical protein
MTTRKLTVARIVGATLAAMIIAALAAPPAQAATPADLGLAIARKVLASASPHVAYAKLSSQEKTLFDDVERPTNVQASTTIRPVSSLVKPQDALAAAAYTRCWAMQNSGYAKAAAGNTLYTYGQSVQVCVRSGSVTSVTVYNVWQETATTTSALPRAI